MVQCLCSSDNGYEIGTEPEEKWGWTKAWKGGGKRRGRSPPSVGQWLSKRKKVEGMISDCKNILERAGGEDGTGGEGKDSGCSDAFVSGAAPAETTSPQSVLEGSAQGMVCFRHRVTQVRYSEKNMLILWPQGSLLSYRY